MTWARPPPWRASPRPPAPPASSAAGGDIILSVSLPAAAAMYTAVLAAMNHDPAFRSPADSAVMRILTAKHAYGLLPCPAGQS